MLWAYSVPLLLIAGCGTDAASPGGAGGDSSSGGSGEGGGTSGGAAGATAIGGASGTGGAAGTSGAPALDGGAAGPFETPLDAWTFLPLDGTECGNGTRAGIGVNRSATSNDLVISLEGGGACWDGNTCFTLKTAVHVDQTYDASVFQSDVVAKVGPVTRDPTNRFSMATGIFIPYCTGDLHGGTIVQSYDVGGQTRAMHHVGARNVDVILARIHAAYPSPAIVWVIGSSAGGYGGTLNLQAISRTFPGSEVHLLADCAPLLTPTGTRWSTWQSAWQLRLPGGCTECTTRFGAVVDTLATESPTRRIGLLAYSADKTVSDFFGLDATGYGAALTSLIATSYQKPNTHSFVAQGTTHVMLDKVATTTAADGTPLATFVAGWAVGLPSWRNAN